VGCGSTGNWGIGSEKNFSLLRHFQKYRGGRGRKAATVEIKRKGGGRDFPSILGEKAGKASKVVGKKITVEKRRRERRYGISLGTLGKRVKKDDKNTRGEGITNDKECS